MARVLGVSPSGYYAWRRRGPSVRAQADADLTVRVSAIHARSRGTYGAPRIHAELSAGGAVASRKRVARVMRAAGIAGVSRRRGPRTTRRAVRVRPAPDRVERRFEAAGPNRLWVADITYVPTLAGFLYAGRRPRRVQPAGRGLGDGSAPAHGAGDRGAGDGREAAPAGGGDPSLRPGLPVHVAGLRRPLSGMGRDDQRQLFWPVGDGAIGGPLDGPCGVRDCPFSSGRTGWSRTHRFGVCARRGWPGRHWRQPRRRPG